MSRYSTGKFTGQYKATIGADFLIKELTVPDPLTGQLISVTLQIWDTAGQERFQSLGMGFYRGADACVLVYDITDPHSLDNLDHWRSEFLEQIGGGGLSDAATHFPFVVLGNKIDKAVDRLVPRSRAEQWCMKVASTGGLGMPASQALPHYETSAKTAINVDDAFLEAATLALMYEDRKRRNQPQLFFPPTETIDLNTRQGSMGTSSGGCC